MKKQPLQMLRAPGGGGEISAGLLPFQTLLLLASV